MICQVLDTGDPAVSQCPPGGYSCWETGKKSLSDVKGKQKTKNVEKSKGDGDELGQAPPMLRDLRGRAVQEGTD